MQRSWGRESTNALQGLFQLCHLRVLDTHLPSHLIHASHSRWDVQNWPSFPLFSVAPKIGENREKTGKGKFYSLSKPHQDIPCILGLLSHFLNLKMTYDVWDFRISYLLSSPGFFSTLPISVCSEEKNMEFLVLLSK